MTSIKAKYRLWRVSLLMGMFPMIFHAQTHLKGTVIDHFLDPLSETYVGFKGTGNYTITDDKGCFELYSNKKEDTLFVSLIGYKRLEISLIKREMTNLMITLAEDNTLKEVIITQSKKRLKKKENPAYTILKKIWQKRRHNGLYLEKIYEYRKHTSLESGGNLSEKFMQKTSVFRKRNTLPNYVIVKDSINAKNVYGAPISLREMMKHYYVDNNLNKQRVDVEYDRDLRAFKTNNFLFERFENAFGDTDIYKNSITILDNPFESPISKTGFSVYNYTLTDSMQVKGHKFYYITFYPRNPRSLAFQGEFMVATPSYAVTEINMSTLKDLNANLVQKIILKKTFTIRNDTVYLPEKSISKISFSTSRKNKDISFYINKGETYGNFIFNRPRSKKFYNQTPLEDAYFTKGDSDRLLDSLYTASSKQVKTAIQNIQRNKKIQFTFNIANILSTGFVQVNDYLQLGNILGFYTYNSFEGSRYSIGGRSFKTLNDRFRTYGYYAYSSRIQRSNFAIFSSYLMNIKPRLKLGIFYIDDLRQSTTGSTPFDFYGIFFQNSQGLFAVRANNYVSKIRSYGIGGELFSTKDNNLKLGLSFSRKEVVSADMNTFKAGYFDGREEVSHFNVSPIALSIRYTPTRNILGNGVEQGVGDARYPTFAIGYSKSSRGVLNSQIDYQKLNFLYSYPLRLGRFGVFEHTIQYGRTFGVLPILLLDPISSNISALSDSQGFFHLNNYDFVMDRHLFGGIQHRFNGYILNKIPLINKLRFRSVLMLSILYGDISRKNIDANRSSIRYNTPNPYYEYGFGIENIGIGTVRIIRVNFIWRGTLPETFIQNNKNAQNPEFGIRVALQFNRF